MLLIKAVVGKDLSKYSLPVFINEPLTILQKTAEILCFTDLLTTASIEKDPLKRMALIVTY